MCFSVRWSTKFNTLIRPFTSTKEVIFQLELEGLKGRPLLRGLLETCHHN